MPTRTIRVSEEAYQRLANLKAAKESFSELVLRLTSPDGLESIAWVLTEPRAGRMKRKLRDLRETQNEAGRRRIARMKGDAR